MRALIIEDETAAANNLVHMLRETDPSIVVVEVLDTVVESVRWLQGNDAPELIFMDIHLSDGQAFKIFDRVEVASPIIFTTAYDQYALEAFRFYSIDYLLKPIKSTELHRALTKFRQMAPPERSWYIEQVNQANVEVAAIRQSDPNGTDITVVRPVFLIPHQDKLVPLKFEEIAFCYTNSDRVTAVRYDGYSLPLDKSLDQLAHTLPGTDFFRANRQFIISRQAIRDITVWAGSRLRINLNLDTPEPIIISKARTSEMKRWFTGV